MYRTNTCGELRATHAGQTVTLAGWVHRRRDHGGVVFLDLRDRAGLVQITINPDIARESLDLVNNVRMEWVLQIEGMVQKRPERMENPKMKTGEIEVIATTVTVLNPSKTPPFMVNGENDLPDENTRLKYRYLDLRRERMTRNIVLRHKVIKFMRDYLATRKVSSRSKHPSCSKRLLKARAIISCHPVSTLGSSMPCRNHLSN